MKRWLVLFEDSGWRALRPLTDLLPMPALAFGASTLGARWETRTQSRLLACEARPGAMAAWRHAPPRAERPHSGDLVMMANAAALPGDWLAGAFDTRNPTLGKVGDRIAGAQAFYEQVEPGLGRGERFESFLGGLGLPEAEVDARFLRWPWQLVEWNEEALLEDLAVLEPERRGAVHELAALLEPSRIRIERGARVDPQVVLDAAARSISART